MDLDKILSYAVRDGASDIVLKTGSVIKCRIQNELIAGNQTEVISPQIMLTWIKKMLPSHLAKRFESSGDADFTYVSSFGQRFRVNLFRQRQNFAAVLRVINNHIKSIEELQLPAQVNRFAEAKRGLILVTGATGSGKSTTLASMIDKINRENYAHIITVEDPIEYWFKDKSSTINQREIGVDTQSFSKALRAALRQNPDVILVGELRDKETIETALMAAETGHLVFSTLHTTDAVESLTRFMSYFPPEQSRNIRMVLSQCLIGIISQRLVPRANGKGMVAAIEILTNNALVKETILTSESFDQLKDAIRAGFDTYGMQSFDQSLLQLFYEKVITREVLLEFATNRDDVKLALEGIAA